MAAAVLWGRGGASAASRSEPPSERALALGSCTGLELSPIIEPAECLRAATELGLTSLGRVDSGEAGCVLRSSRGEGWSILSGSAVASKIGGNGGELMHI